MSRWYFVPCVLIVVLLLAEFTSSQPNGGKRSCPELSAIENRETKFKSEGTLRKSAFVRKRAYELICSILGEEGKNSILNKTG